MVIYLSLINYSAHAWHIFFEMSRATEITTSYLRWRVTWFVHVLKHSVAQASFVLGVSERTVERYISKFLVTGDVK